MLPSPNNVYFDLRTRCGAVRALREKEDSPPEQLLQAVWQHQRMLRERLKTVDGRKVSVLHPGFWSFEGGPDFRDALIQFGDDHPVRGDIEVDMRPSCWRAHNHDRNPAFKNVVLHVVWDGEKPVPGGPSLLVLQNVLDSSIGELSLWLGAQSPRELPEQARGKCCAPLGKMQPAQVHELLLQAAEVRLASKTSWFESRGRQVGWNQCLWEGLFRGLGYKHNAWPMQRLAELRPRWCATDAGAIELQARLFGIGGMLPSDLRLQTTDGFFARKLWDSWWRERDAFEDCILPREAWRLHGLRPANHPQRRLALAAHWTMSDSLPSKIEEWCTREIPRANLLNSLEELLRGPEDEFWSWHWTFRSARMHRAQPLLGKTRATDLAINVVLPWLSVRAVEGKNRVLLDRIRQRYFEWPAAEDNSVLKLARQRLLGTSSKKLFVTAAAQQGLIQIVRDFCDHSNSICEKCRLPEMTEAFASREVKPEPRSANSDS